MCGFRLARYAQMTGIPHRLFSPLPPTSARYSATGSATRSWCKARKRRDKRSVCRYNILQAAGSRIFKTDYVACPSCGRTLFNLQTTTAKIKAATLHLKGVKIAIMGCIVNGPGEMADADFGYVGGAPGKVNLYVGKTAVKFNIPEAEAVDRLKDLIREHGKWIEPAHQHSRARTCFIAQRNESNPGSDQVPSLIARERRLLMPCASIKQRVRITRNVRLKGLTGFS